MAEKRYYWFKLKDDFFDGVKIKKLRQLAGGDTYTIIYLKMLLKAMKHDGVLEYQGVEGNICEEIALDIDEKAENVQVALTYLLSKGLAEQIGDDCFLPESVENVGSENSSAQRVREYRNRQKALQVEDKKAPKSNSVRQKQFRAKKKCEEKQHIPFIEDYINNQRYNGNYYVVIQRDRYKCAICGSIENLCVHHIDGYDESKPQNNATNKMLTLCRCCHSNVHAGLQISEDILDAIDYYTDSNEMLPGNTDVTQVKRICNAEKEIEKEKDIEKKKSRVFTPPTRDEVSDYAFEINSTVNVDNFLDYYESNGWMVGKNKMKDWKATFRRWSRENKKTTSSQLDAIMNA